MANADHFKLLKGEDGVRAWNQWRESHLNIEPDLQGASLVGATLEQVDLHNANLEQADLHHAILSNANLRGAQLRGATLREATLRDVDLREAVGLVEEQFGGSDLAGAKLPEGISTFKEGLSRVEATSQSLQQVLLSLLVACLYGWLTMAATTHAQLVTNAASTPLPIIGTQIPIVGFFIVAPLLILCFYVYFHLYMQQLWEMLAALPAVFPDGRPLDRKSYPRPLGGFMRTHCFLLRSTCTTASRLQARSFVLLAWWSVPLTLGAFLWSYLPRHDWVGAGLLLLFLIVSMAFGFLSYLNATTTLLGHEADEDIRSVQGQPSMLKRWSRQELVTASSIALGALVVVAFFGFKVAQSPNCSTRNEKDHSWNRQELLPWQYIFCYPVAHLAREDISRKAPGWSGQKPEEQLAFVTGASIPYSDLQYAMAFRTFLVKADLYKATLSHAYLREADLRNAQLQGAKVQGADLIWALLAGADLRQANLQGALLFGADLTGAYLSVFTNCNEGCLAPVTLSKADLRRAWLIGADLKGADLSEAQLQEADLSKAQLQGACLWNAKLQNAKLYGAKLGEESISKICEKDPVNVCLLKSGGSQSACSQQRVRPPAPGSPDTFLTGANLEGANLAEAHLDGADLTAANLRGVDVRKAKGLTQEQLNKACTDDKTQLPDHLSRPKDSVACQRWQ